MEQRARAQIQAEEDKRIFEILDMIATVPMCFEASHRPQTGMGCMVQSVDPIPCHKCPHPECVVRGVLES